MDVKLPKEQPLRNTDNKQLGNAIAPETQAYIHAATSDNTRKAYRQDIRHFRNWGGILPTSADVILRYLSDHATTLNPRTLIRRMTALKQWHTTQGFTDPTTHPLIRKTLRGIQQVHGKPKAKALPITLDILQQLIEATDNRLIDLRNRALLLIGFFGAFRRSELVSLKWEWIRWVPEGIEILIPRSKTDQIGAGQVCAIPKGQGALCPISALRLWCEEAVIESGPIFRQMTRSERVKEWGIAPRQVNMIIQALARRAELPDAEQYSSHSLRRGFATQASKIGAPFGAIKRQGRWRHEGTVLGYIDEGKRFEANAAGMVLEKVECSAERLKEI